jgi:hypothetical protein
MCSLKPPRHISTPPKAAVAARSPDVGSSPESGGLADIPQPPFEAQRTKSLRSSPLRGSKSEEVSRLREQRQRGGARRYGLCFSSDTSGRLEPSLLIDRYCAEATR